MATVLDTSALTVLIRRGTPRELKGVSKSARDAVEGGGAVVSVVTAAELFVGARNRAAIERLSDLLDVLPVVSPDREIAGWAARMGASARGRGATIPVPDLLIAATATWLDISLLTCDSDFRRGKEVAKDTPAPSDDPDGIGLWDRLPLHPGSAFLEP